MAVEDPSQVDQPTLLNATDNIFLAFYTFEMIIKIFGLGFVFNKGAYLWDSWNILDFIIVSTGLISLFLSGSKVNLSGLRAFRILRPLKTISGIQGLRSIVVAMMTTF